MASTDLPGVLNSFFTAPAEASLNAEREYRQIWAKWLNDLLSMINELDNAAAKNAISKQLNIAPVLHFAANIEVGVTMRISGVRETSANASMGLQLATFSASGGFGFMERETHESVLQVRAKYALSNQQITLGEYLGNLSIPVTSVNEVKNAINKLSPSQLAVQPADGG